MRDLVFRWERNLWPPGIRCIYRPPDGPDVSVVKPATVSQFAFLLLLCGAAGDHHRLRRAEGPEPTAQKTLTLSP